MYLKEYLEIVHKFFTENVPQIYLESMYPYICPSIHLQNGFSIKKYPGKGRWDSWESDVSRKKLSKKQTQGRHEPKRAKGAPREMKCSI